jgi:uncharacterized membrane protein
MSGLPGRADRLDALRGLAIVWMVAFHFGFDLNHFGWLEPRQNFYADPFWTTQRTVIVSLFLLCAGMGQALAMAAGQGWPRFWRRWAQVAGCALLVSAGSALMFPRSWISFGVLHGIAVMLLVTRAVAPRLPNGALVALALVAIALPWWWQHPWFDTRLTNWVGLVTRKPVTEDYVPVLPWLGMLWLGVAAGRWALAARPGWLAGPLPGAARPPVWPLAQPLVRPLMRSLVFLGQWPLTVYMLHQPVLIGVLMAVQALVTVRA